MGGGGRTSGITPAERARVTLSHSKPERGSDVGGEFARLPFQLASLIRGGSGVSRTGPPHPSTMSGIAAACAAACGVHGACVNGTCACELNWHGVNDWTDLGDCSVYIPTQRFLHWGIIVFAAAAWVYMVVALVRDVHWTGRRRSPSYKRSGGGGFGFRRGSGGASWEEPKSSTESSYMVTSVVVGGAGSVGGPTDGVDSTAIALRRGGDVEMVIDAGGGGPYGREGKQHARHDLDSAGRRGGAGGGGGGDGMGMGEGKNHARHDLDSGGRRGGAGRGGGGDGDGGGETGDYTEERGLCARGRIGNWRTILCIHAMLVMMTLILLNLCYEGYLNPTQCGDAGHATCALRIAPMPSALIKSVCVGMLLVRGHGVDTVCVCVCSVRVYSVSG